MADQLEIDNSSLLKRAEYIFCNSGQSSIAECLYLRKKALLFPIPNHSEQVANSYLAMQAGLMVYNNEKPENLLREIDRKYSEEATSGAYVYEAMKDSVVGIIARLQKEYGD